MNTLYIVRHGQDTDNLEKVLNGHRDTSLTQLGLEQAVRTGQELRDKKITHIFSSPLKRARQTAACIASSLGIPDVIIENGLIERDFGVLTGKPISDIENYSSDTYVTDKIKYFIHVDQGESFSVLYDRAFRVLKEMDEHFDHASIVLVTHGDIGMMLRAAFYGWGWRRGIEAPYIENSDIVELR